MRRHRSGFWESGIRSGIAGLLIGGACMVACAAVSSCASCFLIGSTDNSRLFAMISLCAGSFCGSYIHGKHRRRRGLAEGAVCGAVIYALLLGISLIAGTGAAEIRKLLLTTLFGAAGGVSGVNSKRPGGLMQ